MGLTFMTKLASGYWHVFDPQNGFTAIRAECLRRLDLDALYDGDFFENDEVSGFNPLDVGLRFPYLLTRRFLGMALFGWGTLFGVYMR
jgi:hypothetical protein